MALPNVDRNNQICNQITQSILKSNHYFSFITCQVRYKRKPQISQNTHRKLQSLRAFTELSNYLHTTIQRSVTSHFAIGIEIRLLHSILSLGHNHRHQTVSDLSPSLAALASLRQRNEGFAPAAVTKLDADGVLLHIHGDLDDFFAESWHRSCDGQTVIGLFDLDGGEASSVVGIVPIGFDDVVPHGGRAGGGEGSGNVGREEEIAGGEDSLEGLS